MNQMPAKTPRLARQKLSDQIVDRVKWWLMSESMRPGDRLPQEKDLVELFGVSRGTIREALKALEVQGIIRVSAGRAGGAVVVEVPYETAANLLSNYFYFEDLAADEIYAMRRQIEPEMAVTAVEHLTEDDLARMQELIDACDNVEDTPEARRMQRLNELEFHNVIARRSPNSLYSFNCRFINMILAQQVTVKKMYLVRQQEIDRENREAHVELLAAYRARDAERVRKAMTRHMSQCSCHLTDLEAVVEKRFFNATAGDQMGSLKR